ncbi:hypothetical protein JA1_005063 [Spathaspora sp. JA1]|nr:hypothetical protein JA1_005063 [Spathaspora sp. JA1]
MTEAYTGMSKYLYEFQLQLTTTLPSKVQTPTLNVFKRKNLTKITDQPSPPEFEFDNPTKSRISCIRCRKFKKRCSRNFPECNNCESSEELCKYLPRKSRSPHVQPIDLKTYTMRKPTDKPTNSPVNFRIDKKIMPNDLNSILN